MAVIITDTPFQFGIPENGEDKWPIEGLPKDTIKWRPRFREGDFAKVFCRTTSGVRRFVLQRGNGKWIVNEVYEQTA